jgi:hypothetical protein
MSWKHEESLEEETVDDPAPPSANVLGNGQLPIIHEAIETRHEPPQTEIDGQVLRPVIGQAPRRNYRKASQNPRLKVSESLGLTHPSKVSKATGKALVRPQRRQKFSQKTSSSSLVRPSSMDIGEPQPLPVQGNLRRSKRLQPPVP